jgi:hypothetical protein
MRLVSIWGLAAGALLVVLGACADEPKRPDDDDGSTGSGGGSSGAGANMTVPGGPDVIGLVATPASMTEGDTVTITATVTDPDGLEDLVGGMLQNSDGGAVYGPFTQLSGGTFSIALSWTQLNQVEPIHFDTELLRTLRAEFTDTTQKIGAGTVDVTLSCGGGCSSAVNGQCGGPACDCVCSDLYDCGLEMSAGMQLCPGFTGAASEKADFAAQCVRCDALSALVDADDCPGTIDTIKSASPAFADFCDHGFPQ